MPHCDEEERVGGNTEGKKMKKIQNFGELWNNNLDILKSEKKRIERKGVVRIFEHIVTKPF